MLTKILCMFWSEFFWRSDDQFWKEYQKLEDGGVIGGNSKEKDDMKTHKSKQTKKKARIKQWG